MCGVHQYGAATQHRGTVLYTYNRAPKCPTDGQSVPEKENPTFILYIMSKFPVNLSTVIWEFMRKLTGELVIQGFS